VTITGGQNDILFHQALHRFMMASNRRIHIMSLRRRKSEMDCFRFAAARLFACVTLALTAGVVADAAPAETVRVGIIGASSDAPFFIADAKGYFGAEGLALELMSFDSGAKMVAPLGTGDLDAGGGAVSVGLYNAVKRGVGLKVVADKVHYGRGYGFASLLVRKELVESGKFKSYADLKGLRVAISGVGIGDESVLNEALKRGGLKWGDATPVYMGFAQHPPALANGAVDASITNEPTSTFIQRQGSAVRFAGNDEFYPNQQTAVLLYGEPFIKNRRPVALKFMRAYIRAVRFYNDALAGGRLAGPNGPEVISILTRYSSLKDADLYRVITPPAIDPNGAVNLESLTKDWQFFKDTGQLDGKVGPSDIVDTSFAAEAVAAFGPYVAGTPAK
jgi:NitT/TauT family transport system substrate-binding protein